MASNADLVLRNFAWKISGITPTSALIDRSRFTEVNTLVTPPDQSSGIASRGFEVTWLGSDEDNTHDDSYFADGHNVREAVHRYMVEVYYSTRYRREELQRAVLQDRHDMTKLLRDNDGSGSSFVGYNASNSSTNIGIHYRIRESDELVIAEDYWIYRAIWRVLLEENE
jgi:hypothetical protein